MGGRDVHLSMNVLEPVNFVTFASVVVILRVLVCLRICLLVYKR
jgi:hypothetical protein